MLPQKNNVAPIRNQIIVKVAESFIKDRFKNADKIPEEIMPDGAMFYHQNIETDREIIKNIALAVMGFCPADEEGKDMSLYEYGQEALKRDKLLPSKLSVIGMACQACMKQQHVVTNFCRGCIARPCQMNCPKGAISFTKQNRAYINPELCINCGMCFNSCPYNAIIKVPVPCEDSCPVGAITKDENGKEHIDNEKCISCGKCLRSCPFGAIVEPYQMIDVLKAIKDDGKKVAAMLAPAVIGQFGGTINQVIGAMKKLGFADVFEVAVGADITTQKEAAEFIERMEKGEKFMTTSCCPAYFRAAETAVPEIAHFVSDTHTPMYYAAELVKKEHPDYVTVFVGPCYAKRVEAESDPFVDYVITFEEMGAMFAADGIEVSTCEAQEFSQISYAQGRQFPVTGGVAGAVKSLVDGKAEIRCEAIDGLTKESLKLLKRYALKGSENNMIEVMCCEGGCVAGPGCLAMPRKAAVAVGNYVKTGADLRQKLDDEAQKAK